MPVPSPIPPVLKNWGSLGADALLSKTPNQQALMKVHEGLSHVPGGQLFEAFFQAVTGRDASGSGSGGAGLTASQAAELTTAANQSTAAAGDSHTAANGFGGLVVSDAVSHMTSGVWAQNGIGANILTVLDWVSYAGMYSLNQMSNAVYRDQNALNFYVRRIASSMGHTGSALPNFNGAHNSANSPGESDFHMLQRLYPARDWTADYNGSPYVGAFIEQIGGTWSAEVYYIPQPPTLAEIKKLWDYTPSSGLPVRNGIEDSMQIWSLLPVQY